MALDPASLIRLALVFARVSGVLASAPVFGQKGVPVTARVLLGVLLSLILTGFATDPLPAHADHPVGFLLAVATEALTGLLMGYAIRFVFWAVEFAGEMIGFQMSLSMAQAFDPMSGSSANPLGKMVSWLFLVLFVALDGPQAVVAGLARSFAAVPLGGANLAASGPLLLSWTGGFFVTAVRLAMPFLVALFLVDVALGVFARVVPQADLFSISLPLKLLAGMAIASAFVGTLVPLAPGLVEGATAGLDALFAAIAP
ncbi:flagellar biosynthetic protein FliR [Rubrivirga sp. IMCC45206]|uniref:flagellar biosynthetic protein FliR n=1 Tax=Rubrivirga sp. IMCC45206 TaxID=3391614 RepID=UPI00399001D8